MALHAWSLCHTQLVVAPFGGIVGLNYAGCQAILELKDMWHERIVDGLRIVEREAIMLMKPKDKARDFHAEAEARLEEGL